MVPRPLVARSPAGGGAFSAKIKITAGPVRISWSPEVKVGPEIFKVTDRLLSRLVTVRTNGPVKIVVPSDNSVRSTCPFLPVSSTGNVQSWPASIVCSKVSLSSLLCKAVGFCHR